MKKVLVAALAVALAAVMAIPAGAFENQFGGYWRVRAYTNTDFSGDKSEAQDVTQVSSRSQIYYTAKFSDNLKFVNKFEMDAVWGSGTYGETGADGKDIEIKNTYVDFNLGNYNFKLGTQAFALGRSFVFDADASGAAITGTFGGVEVPFSWIKVTEGGMGPDKNDADRDIYAVAPVFKSGNFTISPYVVAVVQEDATIIDKERKYVVNDKGEITVTQKEVSYKLEDDFSYNIGIDVDASFDAANVWFSAIYQGGEYEINDNEMDRSAYLAAIGGDCKVGAVTVRGQMFYASGDDDDDSDDEAFGDITGEQSYYWSEIMGYGILDDMTEVSNGSPKDKISNITAFNLGASVSPMDKLTVNADLWYAMRNEKVKGEDKLGTEIDLSATYNVMENLDLDVVAAYLFADDATGDEDPMEIGAQLSLSF